MRIAVIAPPWNNIPPRDYGGTEEIVDILCRGYKEAGHEPVLFASADSKCPVEKRSPLRHSQMPPDKYQEHLHIAGFLQAAQQEHFDVVHSHLESIQAYADHIPAPILCTLHVEITPERERFIRHNDGAVTYVGISKNHASTFPVEVDYIHHGLELARFHPSFEHEHYVVFLGAVNSLKGADIATRAATELGIPIRIAGPVKERDELWFEEEVLGLGSGKEVEYLGTISFDEKVPLMRKALAVLCPVTWEEPFGLVGIEAMACGTPVVAMNRGSFPELLEDKVTGFLCEDENSFTESVVKCRSLDRRACRRRVEKRFSHSRMVERYIAALEKLVEGA